MVVHILVRGAFSPQPARVDCIFRAGLVLRAFAGLRALRAALRITPRIFISVFVGLINRLITTYCGYTIDIVRIAARPKSRSPTRSVPKLLRPYYLTDLNGLLRAVP